MFDIGAAELLLVVIVAIVVIGPKDLPLAMRTAGRWIGRLRKMSAHFRSGLDAMVREAELEDMEAQWKKQNEKIMREYPDGVPAEMEPTGAFPAKPQGKLAKPGAPLAGPEAGEPQAVEAAGAESATPRPEPVPEPAPAPETAPETALVPPENPDPAATPQGGS